MTSLNAIGVDLSYTATGIAWAVDASDVFNSKHGPNDPPRPDRSEWDVWKLKKDGTS